jgi:16S rRNA processing protein RimM
VQPVERLEVGRVGKAHGLRGDVMVVPITNRDERFAAGAFVDVNGVDDRDAAEQLRGALLTGAPLDDLSDDEVWAHEVIGAEVVDREGTVVGEVVALEANPAHDLLVLRSGVLIPVVFVVAKEPGRVVVDLPEGLLELFG